MITEYSKIILTVDLPEYNLEKGDVGIVVMIHNDGAGFEVEFMALNGETITVATLGATMVRTVSSHEIAHVRSLVA